MSKKLTVNEAKVLSKLGYEQEDEEFVLCFIEGKADRKTVATIGSLCNKGWLEQDEDGYFWISQEDYRRSQKVIEIVTTLEGYSMDYGIPFDIVYQLYSIMPTELYDGLVTELEDIAATGEFDW